MKNSNDYMKSVHRLGRLGSLGALLFMLGIPVLVSTVYEIWPDLGTVLKVSSGLLLMFIPLAISEVISYMPILGTASYITYITGNVMNLKIPCALNALNLTNTPQGTEKADVIATLSIAASSIITMLIISLGVLLLVPLAPVFENPKVQIATNYMLPALFGGMFLPMFLNNTVGKYRVKGRLLPAIIPFILVLIINTFIFPLGGYEGLALLVVIPLSILIARIFYKKNIIKMTKIDKSNHS